MKSKLPTIFWIIIGLVVVLLGVLVFFQIKEHVNSSTIPSSLPKLECEKSAEGVVSSSSDLEVKGWGQNTSSLYFFSNQKRNLSEFRLVNTDKKNTLYESTKMVDLCVLVKECNQSEIVDVLRDDLILVESKIKLTSDLNKIESSGQGSEHKGSYLYLLVKSAKNKFIELSYVGCNPKIKNDFGDWKVHFDSKTYVLTLINLKNSILLSSNIKSALSSIHKVDKIEMTKQFLIDGGFLDDSCNKNTTVISQVIFNDSKMLVWLERKPQMKDIVVEFQYQKNLGQWKRTRDHSDEIAKEPGYLASLSFQNDIVLSSYYNTVSKVFGNNMWKWQESKLTSLVGFKSPIPLFLASQPKDNNTYLMIGKSQDLKFYIWGDSFKEVHEIIIKNFKRLDSIHELATYQSNRIIIFQNVMNGSNNLSRFECRTLK